MREADIEGRKVETYWRTISKAIAAKAAGKNTPKTKTPGKSR